MTRYSGSMAIKAGGGGDAVQREVLWSTSDGSYVPSPVIHNGHLYWVDGSPAISKGQIFLRSNLFLYCIDDND